MENCRIYGSAPYSVAVIHGGPGATGEMAPVARELARRRGILEPLQTATSLEGQVDELRSTLELRAVVPVVLIGFSWGAWLSYIIAARYPELARKLLLVSSGPFEERYAAQLEETRWKRLNVEQREEWQAIGQALCDPITRDKDALLARLGILAASTDTYDRIPAASEPSDAFVAQGDVFQSVWEIAAEWRRSGRLLELGRHIRCPVIAFHGDYDPHPAEGVRKPLSALLKDFRFVLLKNCGHTPWLERQAKDSFYEAIQRELA